MAKASDSTNNLLADTERDQLFLQHRATLKQKVPEVTYAFSKLQHDYGETCLSY